MALIIADERRNWVEAGEVLQHRHHILGLATQTRADLQAQTAVLINHVQKLQPSAIGGGIKLEVHGPDLMQAFGLMAPNGAVGRTSQLLLSGSGHRSGSE